MEDKKHPAHANHQAVIDFIFLIKNSQWQSYCVSDTDSYSSIQYILFAVFVNS